MIYEEHTIKSTLGVLKVQGNAAGKVQATVRHAIFPEMAMAFELADAEALHVALGLVIDQVKRGGA